MSGVDKGKDDSKPATSAEHASDSNAWKGEGYTVEQKENLSMAKRIEWFEKRGKNEVAQSDSKTTAKSASGDKSASLSDPAQSRGAPDMGRGMDNKLSFPFLSELWGALKEWFSSGNEDDSQSNRQESEMSRRATRVNNTDIEEEIGRQLQAMQSTVRYSVSSIEVPGSKVSGKFNTIDSDLSKVTEVSTLQKSSQSETNPAASAPKTGDDWFDRSIKERVANWEKFGQEGTVQPHLQEKIEVPGPSFPEAPPLSVDDPEPKAPKAKL